MQYNIYSIYNAIVLQEAVEEIDVKRYLRNESCKEGRVEKAFIDHSAISWQENLEQITSQTFVCVVVGFLSKWVLEQLLQNFCQLLPKSSAFENSCQLLPKSSAVENFCSAPSQVFQRLPLLTKKLCCGISLEGSRRKRAAVARVAKVAKCTFSQFSTLDASHTHPEHF